MSNLGVYRSITQVGTYEPFELQVARGQITEHSNIIVTGYNTDVDQVWETIWSDGALSYPASATVVKISSGNAADNATGTGARTVLISGLDANYNSLSETVVLNGQTPVNTTNSYFRINNFAVASAGANATASGIIYAGTGNVTTGVPQTLYEQIPLTWNARQTVSYTVPAGYTAYIPYSRLTFAQASGTNAVWGRLVTESTNFVKMATVSAVANNGIIEFQPKYPVRVPEKTLITAEGMGTADNNYVSAIIQILLIKNAITGSNG